MRMREAWTSFRPDKERGFKGGSIGHFGVC